MTQLLIRFGKLASQKDCDGNIPDKFNSEKLTKLFPEQIVWWDESHWKCVIGGNNVNSQGDTVQFKRDSTGKLSPNGEYAEKPTKLDVKYEEEARFCLGVGVVAYDNIVVEGPPGENGTLPLLALVVLPHMAGRPADLYQTLGTTTAVDRLKHKWQG